MMRNEIKKIQSTKDPKKIKKMKTKYDINII